ncbi:unnamed protein product [Amoebophrya sp. A25]|nr:unnamed protein product [Amoebophrya sp. A25]|eukprot:GSA25T00007876001.1
MQIDNNDKLFRGVLNKESRRSSWSAITKWKISSIWGVFVENFLFRIGQVSVKIIISGCIPEFVLKTRFYSGIATGFDEDELDASMMHEIPNGVDLHVQQLQ